MAKVTKERRREQSGQSLPPPLPPSLRAELRARVTEAAVARDKIVAEARRQRKITEQAAAETYERIRANAQRLFEVDRAAIRDDLERRASQG